MGKTGADPGSKSEKAQCEQMFYELPPESRSAAHIAALRICARSGTNPDHSITLSARASSVGEIVSPSAFAVLRFTISSNVSGP